MAKAKSIVTDLLTEAGIELGGHAPWDVRVKDERFYSRVLARRNLGLGESYMEGWWECDRIDRFIDRLLRIHAESRVKRSPRLAVAALPALLFNLQTPARSRIVAQRHYDLGNDLFQSFLDPYLQYSCAWFKNGDGLDRAQENKLDLIRSKLELSERDTLLDIGCGWGGLVRNAVENSGCQAVGVNISREQIAFARNFCQGLDVEIRNQDYREIGDSFDKIVSVGMFEHVGPSNHRRFMDKAASCLKRDGVFLLQTIGSNTTSRCCDPWIEKYIFPNGCLPSIRQVAKAAEGSLVMEDMHNLGPHYDRTLMCWLANFRKAWPGLKDRYSETFRRMWEYYLQSCAGAFRARDIQLWQFAFTLPGSVQPRCRGN